MLKEYFPSLFSFSTDKPRLRSYTPVSHLLSASLSLSFLPLQTPQLGLLANKSSKKHCFYYTISHLFPRIPLAESLYHVGY